MASAQARDRKHAAREVDAAAHVHRRRIAPTPRPWRRPGRRTPFPQRRAPTGGAPWIQSSPAPKAAPFAAAPGRSRPRPGARSRRSRRAPPAPRLPPRATRAPRTCSPPRSCAPAPRSSTSRSRPTAPLFCQGVRGLTRRGFEPRARPNLERQDMEERPGRNAMFEVETRKANSVEVRKERRGIKSYFVAYQGVNPSRFSHRLRVLFRPP